MSDNSVTRLLPNRVIKRRIRKAAIARVKKDLILHGKNEAELSEQDLEYLVADAEESIRSQIAQTSLIGALALLGIGLF